MRPKQRAGSAAQRSPSLRANVAATAACPAVAPAEPVTAVAPSAAVAPSVPAAGAGPPCAGAPSSASRIRAAFTSRSSRSYMAEIRSCSTLIWSFDSVTDVPSRRYSILSRIQEKVSLDLLRRLSRKPFARGYPFRRWQSPACSAQAYLAVLSGFIALFHNVDLGHRLAYAPAKRSAGAH